MFVLKKTRRFIIEAPSGIKYRIDISGSHVEIDQYTTVNGKEGWYEISYQSATPDCEPSTLVDIIGEIELREAFIGEDLFEEQEKYFKGEKKLWEIVYGKYKGKDCLNEEYPDMTLPEIYKLKKSKNDI